MALPVPRGRQRDVLSMRAMGHIVVLGTAGSGKTTVAALRAQILANPKAPHHGRTLLVTYNQSLVTYLRTIAATELAHVTVETFHKFAFGYLASRGKMHWGKVISTTTRQRLIRSAMSETGFADHRITTEWGVQVVRELLSREFTVIARADIGRQEYLHDNVHRDEALVNAFGAGRIYDALEAYRILRDKDGDRYDYDDSLTAAWETMRQDPGPRRYKHIVIDEGQDFAPVMLKMLISAVPADGSVSFFGDVAQQIYGRETNWREAGFNVSSPEIFEENLRNTPEIARLGLAIAQMPYYRGVSDLIAPTTPMDEGPPPTLLKFASFDDELRAICQQAINAVGTQNVAVICPTKALVENVLAQLAELKENRVIPLDRDIKRWYTEDEPRIYVSNYFHAKGLEFGAVILPFVSEHELPSDWPNSVYGAAEAATRAGSQLYVGVTRCRRNLVITHHGTVSPLLPPNDGAAQLLYRVRRAS